MNPVVDLSLNTVGPFYQEACHEICAAYGVALQDDAAPPPSVEPGKGCFRSMLVLTGRGIVLTSVLSIEDSLLVATHGAMMPEGPPLDREDWCREFSNQLGGRLKNKLLPLGIEVKVGLASTDPQASAARPDGRHHYAFTSSKGWLHAELSMQVSPDFAPAEVPGVVTGDALLEGMYLMF